MHKYLLLITFPDIFAQYLTPNELCWSTSYNDCNSYLVPLETIRTPESFRAKHYISAHLDYIKQNNIPSSIESFNNILEKLWLHTAFATLTLFHNTNFDPPKYPIIVRRRVPMYPKNFPFFAPREIFWVHKRYNNSIRIADITCPSPKFQGQVPKLYISERCLRISQNDMLANSKPWQGELHILLFVPNHVLIENYGFYRDTEEYAVAPSRAFVFHVLISRNEHDYNGDSIEFFVRHYTKHVWNSYYRPIFNHQIFLHAYSLKNSSTSYRIVLRPKPWNVNNDQTSMEFSSSKLIQSGDKYLEQVFQNIPTFYINGDDRTKTMQMFTKVWDACKLYKSKTSPFIKTLQDLSTKEAFAFIQTIIVTEVMGNLTRGYVDVIGEYVRYFCVNGQSQIKSHSTTYNRDKVENKYTQWHSDIVPSGFTHITHQLEMEIRESQMKFVTCGQRGVESLPFKELYQIYQPPVWIIFGLFFCLLPLILVKPYWSMFTKNLVRFHMLSKTKNWLIFYKIAVEQGDPIPTSLAENPGMRLILGSVLLSGIVLSNAYKNSNVYNLITNRQPLLYETLEHLKEAKFTIYSSVEHLQIRITSSFYLNIGSTTHSVYLRGHPDNLSFNATTKVSVTDATYRNSNVGLKKIHRLGNLTMVSKINREKVVTHIARLWKVVHSLQKPGLLPIYIGILHPMHKVMVERFRTEELKWAKSAITTCSGTAYIFADKTTHELAKEISGTHAELVSVGREKFGGQSVAWRLQYHVNPLVLRRISNVKESGIVTWLTKLPVYISKEFTPKAVLPKPASIYGNTLVVFVILACGLVLAAATLAWEMKRKVCMLVTKITPSVLFVGKWFRKILSEMTNIPSIYK